MRIKIKVPPVNSKIRTLDVVRIRGRGIRSTISISKTIKIIARRKNRIEKGVRAL